MLSSKTHKIKQSCRNFRIEAENISLNGLKAPNSNFRAEHCTNLILLFSFGTTKMLISINVDTV